MLTFNSPGSTNQLLSQSDIHERDLLRAESIVLFLWLLASIHTFSVMFILHRVMRGLESTQGGSGHNVGDTLDVVTTHRRAQSYTHTFTHYGQFRDASQPTYVFGLGKKLRTHRQTGIKQAKH